MFKVRKKLIITLTLLALTGSGLAGCGKQSMHHMSTPTTAKQKENHKLTQDENYQVSSEHLTNALGAMPAKYKSHVQLKINENEVNAPCYVMIDTGQNKDNGKSVAKSDVTANTFKPVTNPKELARAIWKNVYHAISKQKGPKIPVIICYRYMTGIKHIKNNNTEPDNEDQYKDVQMYKVNTKKATLSPVKQEKVISQGNSANS